MKYYHLIAGMRMGPLLRLLLRHGVTPRPTALLRTLFLLQSSLWSSLFALIEKARFGKTLATTPHPDDPIIIVGHWRTGSTFLHQIFQLDPELTAPTTLQCCLPDSFLVSERYAAPVIAPLLAATRPMDNVRLALDEPCEDEFALFRMTGISPLESLFFQKSERYFLLDHDPGCFNEEDVARWEKALCLLLKKIRLRSGKRIVLKNPFHSLRLHRLLKLFPRARFVHIHRDPRQVIPSTVRMWNIVGRQNTLGRRVPPPRLEEVVSFHDRMLTTVRRDLSGMPRDAWVEIKFEELEARPAEVLRRAYDRIGLTFSPAFEGKLDHFLEGTKGYRKNRYDLTPGQRLLITEKLRHHMAHDGYL